MKKRYLAYAVPLFLAFNVQAGGVIFGSYDCGEWINSKNEIKKAWLMGYVSGLNAEFFEASGGKDPLNKLNSAQQMFLWVDNYCREHPLRNLSGAGYLLIEELKQ